MSSGLGTPESRGVPPSPPVVAPLPAVRDIAPEASPPGGVVAVVIWSWDSLLAGCRFALAAVAAAAAAAAAAAMDMGATEPPPEPPSSDVFGKLVADVGRL